MLFRACLLLRAAELYYDIMSGQSTKLNHGKSGYAITDVEEMKPTIAVAICLPTEF
jgi:hypothetical protein